jgi:hypothetical protein
MKEDIERIAKNPDELKSAEGRYNLINKINSLNYGKIAELNANVANLTEYNKNVADMKRKNEYNGSWDDVNPANYDTLSQGMLGTTAPQAFRSMHDIVKPFTANLKADYLGKKGAPAFMYWKGISGDKIASTVQANMSSIMSDPAAAYHMRDIKRNIEAATGKPATNEQIMQEFVAQATMSQADYATQEAVLDHAALSIHLKSLSGNNNNGTVSPMAAMRASINEDVKRRMRNSEFFGNGSAYADNMGQYQKEVEKLQSDANKAAESLNKQYIDAKKAGNKELMAELVEKDKKLTAEYAKRMGEYSALGTKAQEQAFKAAFEDTYGTSIDGVKRSNVDPKRYDEASKNLLNQFSGNAPIPLVERVLDNVAVGTKLTVNKGESNSEDIHAWKVSSSSKLILPQELAEDLMGKKEHISLGPWLNGGVGVPTNQDNDVFGDAWRAGKIKGISIVPDGQAVPYIDRTGQPVQAMKVKVYVPDSEFYGSAGMNRGSWLSGKNSPIDSRNDQLKWSLGAETKNINGEKYRIFDAYYPVEPSAMNDVYFDAQTINKDLFNKTATRDENVYGSLGLNFNYLNTGE